MIRLQSLWRRCLNIAMLTLTGVAAFAVVSVLLLILGYLAWNGAKSLSWNFFTKLPAPVGETGGGIANAIVGSGKLLLLAALIGLPVGLLAGIYLAEFGGKIFGSAVRYAADLLNGVPSIIVGVFVWILVVKPMGHFSTLAGGVALGIMVIPITIRSAEAFLRSVPVSMREGALALGASKWRMIATVVVPAAKGGIITGMLLALARVAGETAPLLFTAFGNQFWSPGWGQPISSLPLVIYTYGIGAYPEWHQQAWAAGLVLLVLVLLANIGARLVLIRGTSIRNP